MNNIPHAELIKEGNTHSVVAITKYAVVSHSKNSSFSLYSTPDQAFNKLKVIDTSITLELSKEEYASILKMRNLNELIEVISDENNPFDMWQGYSDRGEPSCVGGYAHHLLGGTMENSYENLAKSLSKFTDIPLRNAIELVGSSRMSREEVVGILIRYQK